MKQPYQIRFHLGLGENYLKWQLKNIETKEIIYIDPEEYSVKIKNARLVNRKSVALSIFKGSDKTPCAWIRFSSFSIEPPSSTTGDYLHYNPRKAPYWKLGNLNVDNSEFDDLITKGRLIYLDK